MVNAYLHFPGTCAEAFRFYEKLFGGKITMLMTHGESPMKDQVPADWRDKVIHVSLELPGGMVLGSDAPPDYYVKPQGFAVSVSELSVADAERMFAQLAEGGSVQMAFAPTFWAERFGMCTDRFGIPWMLSAGEPPTQ